MSRILFTHSHLVIDGKREYEDGALLVNGETIEDVFIDSGHIRYIEGEYEERDLEGRIVMPGFFDTHNHGCFGINYTSASKEEINEVSRKMAVQGTTSFLMTLLNNEKLLERLRNVEDLECAGSRFQGIHLEGPFINMKYKGAINGGFILGPDMAILESYLDASSNIRQMTVSPELEGIRDIIRRLNAEGIKVMCGHSDALKEDLEGIEYDGFTHLFNATRPLGHRELSLVNVALDGTDKYVEVVADGIHLDTSVLRLIYRNIRRDRIMIITDSTHVAGLADGECVFEGEKCLKKGPAVRRIKDGRLAGGASSMADCVKVMRSLGVPFTDLLLMSSLNAYRLYGLDKRFGTLEKGKYADIVIMNDEMDLLCTYMRGKRIDA